MEAFIGGVISVLFWAGLGILVLLGWLTYQLFKEVLIPLCHWALIESENGANRLAVWYREVTWRRRMVRIHNETIQAIDTLCEEQVAQARVAIETLEQQHEALLAQQQTPTASQTAAVRVAVRGR